MIVSSVRVRVEASHDIVRVWNRHALAGELVVTHGDGHRVAVRLIGDRFDVAPVGRNETHYVAAEVSP